jgi:DNA-binding FrmR family transcriptional regulator
VELAGRIEDIIAAHPRFNPAHLQIIAGHQIFRHTPPGYVLSCKLVAHVVREKKRLLDRIRRIKGQVEAVERGLESDAECSDILHTIAACRGAISSLMTEVLEGHIRFHVIGEDHKQDAGRSAAAEQLIDVIRKYVR